MKGVTSPQFQKYAQDPLRFLGDLHIPGADRTKRFKQVWDDFQLEAFRHFAPCLISVARGRRTLHRGIWLERTKGSSKDSDVGACLLWLLLFSRRPLLIELGADQQMQAAETKKAMQAIVRLNPWMQPYIEFHVTKVSCEQTGVVCEFLTTTITGAHGSRPDMTVCNELSHIRTKEFAETMADNADKLADNFMVIATNAGHLHTWQYDWRETYRRDDNWWFQKFAGQPSWIPQRNVENARKRNSTIRFNRLWQGIWSPQEGDAIDPADIDAAITLPGPMSPEEVRRDDWFVVLGADAGIKHDHAALISLAVRPGSPEIRLARCESWAPGPNGKIDLTLMDAAIIRAYEDFNPLGMCYDPTQMELMAQRAEKMGLPVDPVWFSSGRESDEMVRVILQSFRNRHIKIYPDRLLLQDLHRLSIKESRHGVYKLDAIKDEYGHADRAIALAVALPAAMRIGGQEPQDPEEAGAEHLIAV